MLQEIISLVEQIMITDRVNISRVAKNNVPINGHRCLELPLRLQAMNCLSSPRPGNYGKPELAWDLQIVIDHIHICNPFVATRCSDWALSSLH